MRKKTPGEREKITETRGGRDIQKRREKKMTETREQGEKMMETEKTMNFTFPI